MNIDGKFARILFKNLVQEKFENSVGIHFLYRLRRVIWILKPIKELFRRMILWLELGTLHNFDPS